MGATEGPSHGPERTTRGDGYSLVEVLVAIAILSLAILSLAILPMAGMFDAALRAALLGGNYDKARALANEKLEEIRALPYWEPGGFCSITMRFSLLVRTE